MRGEPAGYGLQQGVTFEFAIQSYGYTKLNVMYTNDPDSVKLYLAEFKQCLQDEKAQGCRTRPCAHPFVS